MKLTPDLSPTLLSTILASIHHGVIVTDHNDVIRLINPDAMQLLQHCIGTKLRDGQHLLETTHECLPLSEVLTPGFKKKSRTEATAKTVAKDGTKRYINIEMEPLETGYLVLLDDVTEDALRAQAKSDFVSLTAHQLKTPVAELKGYAENMLSGATGPLLEKQRHYLEQMKQACDRNFHLIENLLDISQIEEGVMTLNLTPIKLHELVDNVLVDFVNDIQKKSLKFEREGFGEATVVFADPIKTTEALKNVIHNAIKFTDQGSIHIKLSSRGKWGVIEITDTGSGISSAQRKQLFMRGGVLGTLFMSGHGAGLGLYIAKQFLTFQNGTITVLRSSEKGTTFEIKLPKFTTYTPLGKKIKPISVQLNPKTGRKESV